MSSHNYSRGLDQMDADVTGVAATDLSPLVGKWVNTNKNTSGIARIALRAENHHLKVQAFGAGSSGLHDWGEVAASAFAGNVASNQAVGFKAHYDFGSSDTLLAAYLNKRILVVDSYNDFRDGSSRSRYFFRDHFYVEGE